jgi:hypothetical protein
MKIYFNTKTHKIHIAFIALSILTLVFSIFALNNYLQAKNIEKNGKQVSGIVTEIFCFKKKQNNGTVTLQLPSEGMSKKMKINNCTFVHVGDTIMVQFLSPEKDILEYNNGNILTGRFLTSTLMGVIAALLIFFIGIKKITINNL